MGIKSRILIVDDSAAIRQQVLIVLSEAGYDVVQAFDGVDGVASIATNYGIKLVLCDVDMPRMGGLELLQQVRQQPRTAALPVVMLAAEAEQQAVQRAKENGAQGWMIKPFRPEALVATVEKLTQG
ncbi:MAG: response regulator [Deltaproteobacteria bacterium]|nr:response regulator [Deltaproteobacteria bacterium]